MTMEIYKPKPEATERLTPEVIEQYNLDASVDTEHGLSKRIASTIEKHWSKALPVLHITNKDVNWGPGTPIQSTGFVESIVTEGLKQFGNVGHIPSEQTNESITARMQNKPTVNTEYITQEQARTSPLQYIEAINELRTSFIHHGLRTNKNKVNGKVSIPAVILFDGGVVKQPGDDSPYHAQINEVVPPDKVLGVFEFDPNEIVRSYMIEGSPKPQEKNTRHTKKHHLFREELSSNKKQVRNFFIKEYARTMAEHRLYELFALFQTTNSQAEKDRIALAAHELVDSYLLSPQVYDQVFIVEQRSTAVDQEIKSRREKYTLLVSHQSQQKQLL